MDVLTCANCGGVRRLLLAIQDPDSIERVLRAMGKPREAPELAVARRLMVRAGSCGDDRREGRVIRCRRGLGGGAVRSVGDVAGGKSRSDAVKRLGWLGVVRARSWLGGVRVVRAAL